MFLKRKIFKRIGSDAVPALVKALKDDTVRLAAIDALGFVGQEAKSALPALIEVLKCENADVLHATADALRKIALERGTVNLIIDILIKAIPKVLKVVNNARFTIVGRENTKSDWLIDLRNSIQYKFLDRVYFLGYINNLKTLDKLYQNSDICVIPSRY